VSKNSGGPLRTRWKGWRSKFYFALLWAAIVALVNVILWQLDVSGWWKIWRFRGEGEWFFWLIMGLFTVSMWLIVNHSDAKIRNCGRVVFMIATGACIMVVFFSPSILKADRWTTYEVPFGKKIRLKTEYGIAFSYFMDNDATPKRSGPNGELFKVTGNFDKVSIKPDRDMKATVEFVDNSNP
jgi:hypothetical protein